MRSQKDYSRLSETELWVLLGQNCDSAFQELYDRYAPAVYLGAKKHIPSETFPTQVLISIFSEVWHNRVELAATQDLDFTAYLSQKLNKAIVAEAKKMVNEV